MVVNPYDYYGDPNEIASFSPRVNALAGRIEARSAQLARRVDATYFQGPKAERFRDGMQMSRRSAIEIAGRVGDIGNLFILASVTAANRIYEYEAAMERAEEWWRP